MAGSPPLDGSAWLIEDRYITGTYLRLRRVTALGESVYKLTQKVRPSPGDPFEVALTNMYLTPDEYERLLALPASVLTKTRHVAEVDGVRFAVDQFHGVLQGLALAEVEVERRDLPLVRPNWLGREVTDDDRYSGGRLAHASDEEAAALSSG